MKIKTLLSGSLVYVLTSGFSSGLGFLLLPLLAHYLTPEEFGRVGVFQSLFVLFLPVCSLGIAGSIVRQSYDVDKKSIGIFIFNSLLILLMTTAVLALVLLGGGNYIANILKIPLELFFYALITAAMLSIHNILLGQYQVSQRPMQYGVLQIGHGLVNAILSLVAVILLSAGALGRIGGIAVAGSLFGILSLVIMYRSGRLIFRINLQDIRTALRFGVPLLPHEIGTFMLNWLSLVILNALLDGSEVGVYLLAFQISMVLGVACDAFNKAYVPWLFSILKNDLPENRIRVVKLTYIYFVLLAAIIAISFLLASSYIELAFNEKYAKASWMIGWLVLGQAFGGAYLMVTNYIFYARKTEGLSIITLTGSAVNIALLFWLVPMMGISGAIVAYVVARGAIFFMTWYLANRLVPMPWALSKSL